MEKKLCCSEILVADLKNKRSVKLTIDFDRYFRLKFDKITNSLINFYSI